MKTVAIVPVRGGSKSIPLKNVKLINGRPLVYWTIDAAVNCSYIDEVYVTTDSDLIKQCIENYDKEHYGKLHCIDRDAGNATDNASTESVLLEFVDKFSSDNTILLQATSPLTESGHLEEAFQKFFSSDFDSLLSVVEQKRFIWDEIDGYAHPINYSPNKRPRRQDYKGFLVENGAFYITKTENLIKTSVRISGKIGLYKMPEETYFEIDEETDWIIVEQLLKKKMYHKEKLKRVKLFITDCDGVLTDAGMYYSEDGDVLKKFNTKDGMGFGLLKEKGILTAIATGEDSKIVLQRAQKLNIDHVFLGCKDKVKVTETLLEKYNLTYEEVAFIGDDINDISLLQKVGWSFSVADALDVVKQNSKYTTEKKGGEGAVREAIDLILKGYD